MPENDAAKKTFDSLLIAVTMVDEMSMLLTQVSNIPPDVVVVALLAVGEAGMRAFDHKSPQAVAMMRASADAMADRMDKNARAVAESH
jgi:hypothetical protein